MKKLAEQLQSKQEHYLNELLDILRIPSVSADPKHKPDMVKMAEILRKKLKDIGLDKAEIMETGGHPVVYGEKTIDSSKPTVLVYGHYDVQPADPLNLWHSEPFNPVVKDGKIFARGACDDKGQVYMHVAAVDMMLKNNALPCNVKFLIEGEEEIGSDNLENFIKKHKAMLKADIILISDTAIINNETPSITVGLRGLSYLEVEVTGANRDLHSGVYGGAVANPINVLCKMIASLHDENKHITIPGFYNKVAELTAQERKDLNEAPFDLNEYKNELKINDVYGETGYTTLERTSIRPTLDVNGIWGGYIGEGAKTVLPSKAFAKISMRLVPNQDQEEITKLFQDHFTKIAPAGVTVQIRPHHGGSPWVVSTNFEAYRAASKAMETTFGKKPIPVRGGGSIPIVSMFERELGLKSILMGFGLDSDDIHSPNEHFGVFNFFKGIETIPYFYAFFASSTEG